MAGYYSTEAQYLRKLHQHAGAAWREVLQNLPIPEEMLARSEDILSWGMGHAPTTDQLPHELHYGDSVPKRDIKKVMQLHEVNAEAVREILLNVNDPTHWRKYFFAVNKHLTDESDKVRVINRRPGEIKAATNAREFTASNQFFAFSLQHLGLAAMLGNQYESYMKRPVLRFPILRRIPPEAFPLLHRGITNKEHDRIKRAMVDISKSFGEGGKGSIATSPQQVRERLAFALSSKLAYQRLAVHRAFWAHTMKVNGEELRCAGQAYVSKLFEALGQVLQEPSFAAAFEHAISIPPTPPMV